MDQQPGIDKKAVAAILLCAVIWAVWMNTNYRRTQQLAQQRAAAAKVAATTTTGGTIAVAGTGGAIASTTGTADPSATPLGPGSATVAAAKHVTIENEHLRLELTSSGARPSGADLKDMKYHPDGKMDVAVHALAQLLPPEVEGAKELAPLAPWFGDETSSLIPATQPFEVVSSDATTAVFRGVSPSGLEIERTWKMGDAYSLSMTEKITNRSAAPITARPGISWAAHDVGAADAKRGAESGMIEPGASVANRFQYKTPKNTTDESRTYDGLVEFVALHDRYFTAIAAPTDGAKFDGKASVRFRRPAAKVLQVLALGEQATLAPGETRALSYDLYVGPKDFKILRDEPHHFAWIMNWGLGQGFFWVFVGTITKGLWYALGWLHGIVRNWGVAIILLTLVMRGLLWPLAARQMRTANEFAQKSQKLKPQLDRIREKYGADPMKMNQETMALYKQYGISPFSPLAGCLPLLLQLPIWWALYRVLWTSIDLRAAPFVLWINDLSKPESLFQIGTFDFRLMPILLGGVTWLQMELTPQAGTDPAQQKMMKWMMPFMFTFFMWSLPAGLVIYIFTSTLMGIGQQWLLKRAMNKPQDPPSTGLVEAKT